MTSSTGMTRRTVGTVLAAAFTLATALTAASTTAFTTAAPASSTGIEEVRAAEQAWAHAYEVCDLAAMGTLLSDDLTLIQHVNGSTMGKEPFMKSVGACSMEKVQNDPQRIRVYGDTAAVQGLSTYTIKKMASPISVIFTRVWVKTRGAWQIVNHQSTGVPGPAGAK